MKAVELLEKAKGFGIGVRADIDVAADLKVSRERVRQLRVQFKIPKPKRDASELSIQYRVDCGLVCSLGRQKKTLSQIANATNRSKSSVGHILRKAGIEVPADPSGFQQKWFRQEVVDALNNSRSITAAAKLLKMEFSTGIYRLIRKWNLRSDPDVRIPDGRMPK